MEDKDMIETEEAYYDGTRDEDTEEVEEVTEEAENVEEAEDADGDEDYFDFDDEEEPIEDEDSEDDADDEESDEDDNDDEAEDNGEDAKNASGTSKEGEIEKAVRELFRACKIDNVDNVPEALRRLTAEALGISPEEYDRRIKEEKAREESWNAQMQRDIDEIHAAFPSTRKYKSLKELPNKELFASLMDDKSKKLSAVAAFAASHPDIVKAHSKAPGRGSDLRGTKDHIKSSVPKGAKDTSTYISKGEMAAYREMFPGLSDKEIKKLYKTANK